MPGDPIRPVVTILALDFAMGRSSPEAARMIDRFPVSRAIPIIVFCLTARFPLDDFTKRPVAPDATVRALLRTATFKAAAVLRLWA